MKKCFGYPRVSTIKQGDGASLEAQMQAIKDYAARHNIIIIDWFEEKVTAAKSGRPLFNKMMRQLKDGRAEGVIFHKIDRSTRNFADWAKISDIADSGISVHIAVDDLDFTSRSGRLVADVQVAIAADYIRNLREEVRKSQALLLEKGCYPFKSPLGYAESGKENRGKPKQICEIRGPLVKTALELFATGQYSQPMLREEMTKRGLTNLSGRPLSKAGMSKILNNPFYCGIIRIKKTGKTYQGKHEPLISVEAHERIKAINEGRTSLTKVNYDFDFRGMFKCGICGSTMLAERQKSWIYYRCHTKKCSTKCVEQKKIEAAIESMLSDYAFSNEATEHLEQQFALLVEKQKNDKAISTIPMRLSELDVRLEKLTDAVVEQVIDRDSYNRRKESLLLEKQKLEEERLEETRTENGRNPLKFLELIKNVTEHYKIMNPMEKRRFLNWATSNRTIVGKNLVFEPSNVMKDTHFAVGVFEGGQSRARSRSSRQVQDKQIAKLVQIANSVEAEKLDAILRAVKSY